MGSSEVGKNVLDDGINVNFGKSGGNDTSVAKPIFAPSFQSVHEDCSNQSNKFWIEPKFGSHWCPWTSKSCNLGELLSVNDIVKTDRQTIFLRDGLVSIDGKFICILNMHENAFNR